MKQTLEQYFKFFAKNNKHESITLLPTTLMAINKSYNENLKQFPHEILYGTILKTIEINSSTNQTASTFATKMKNNWATIGIKITRTRQKLKLKLNAKKKKTLSRSNQRKKHFY